MVYEMKYTDNKLDCIGKCTIPHQGEIEQISYRPESEIVVASTYYKVYCFEKGHGKKAQQVLTTHYQIVALELDLYGFSYVCRFTNCVCYHPLLGHGTGPKLLYQFKKRIHDAKFHNGDIILIWDDGSPGDDEPPDDKVVANGICILSDVKAVGKAKLSKEEPRRNMYTACVFQS